MHRWKSISGGMSRSAYTRSSTCGCSVVGTEPIPSARAASIRFCTDGMTELACPLPVVSEARGGHVAAVFGRDLLASGPRSLLVAALGPPGLVVQRAELADQLGVVQHQEASRLRVTAAGRLDRCLQDQVHVVHRDRVRSEAADGP